MNEFESLLLVAGGSGISYTLPLLWDTVRRARSMRPPYNNLRDAVATTRIVFVWVIRAVEHASWCSEMLDQICKAIPRGFELVIRIYVTGKKAEIPAQVQPSEPVISQDEEEITVVGTVNGPRVLLGSEIASPTTSPISVGGATMQGQPSACDENKTEDTTAQNTPASVSMTLSPEPSAWPSAQTHAGRPDLADLLESLIERTHPSARVGVACCGPDSLSRSAASAVVGAMDPKRVLKGENRRKVGFNVEEFGW